jgi:predicted MFS family arabinose efflux permease
MSASPIQLYKQAFTGLSKNSWYLCVVMLINRSGTMVIPFMAIYCTHELHFSIVQTGVVMGTFGAGSICGGLIGGILTDKIGFYDLQIGALLSGGVLFIILGFQQTFISVLLFCFILSFCNDSFRPANSSAIAYYSSAENKTRSYSLNRLAINLGWAVGGALGGFLASFNYHLLFWVDGCTNMFAAFMLLKLIPRSNIVKPSTTKLAGASSLSPYKDKVYLLFIVLLILFASCFFQLFSMEPLYYKTIWLLNLRVIGFLMALNGVLIVMIEMVMIHNLEGKRHPLNYICVGVLLVGAGLVLLNVLPHNIWSGVITVIFITFGEMLGMPFMNSFWVARTNDHNRGQYAGLYTIAWSIAQVAAPTLGGVIILHYGFTYLWWLLGGICLVASAGFMVLYTFKFRGKTTY